jgi:glutamate-1-semialdehyde aminotransferase
MADSGSYARFFTACSAGITCRRRHSSAFLSDAHTDDDIDRTLEAADEVVEGLA